MCGQKGVTLYFKFIKKIRFLKLKIKIIMNYELKKWLIDVRTWHKIIYILKVNKNVAKRVSLRVS